MSSYFKITLLAAALASSALAKQNAPSPACTTAPDTACNYSYQTVDANSNPITVFVDAFCGPIRTDGLSYCGDNGAPCNSDNQCYQFCSVTDGGAMGTCGGLGAACYNTAPNDAANSDFFNCDGPSMTCSINCAMDADFVPAPGCGPGTCIKAAAAGPAPSQANGMRKAKRTHRDLAAESRAFLLRRAAQAVAMPGDEQLS